MITRKQYFVDKDFQTQFMIKFCTIVIIASIITGVLLLMFSARSTNVTIENMRVTVKSTADFLLPVILISFIIGTLVAAISTILLCLYTSHKIVGPLYRITREIKKLGVGDFNINFKTREGDQLKDFISALAEAVANLKKEMTKIKNIVSKISASQNKEISENESFSELKKSLEKFNTE